MISVESKGGTFEKTREYLLSLSDKKLLNFLRDCGEEGLEALYKATPKLTGKTSESWYYKITQTSKGYNLIFSNSNIQNGQNIAIIIQQGHASRNGSWIQGRDYINPALKPVMDKVAMKIDAYIKGK